MTDTPTGSTDPSPTTPTPTIDAAANEPTPPMTGIAGGFDLAPNPTSPAPWARQDPGRWGTIVLGVVLLVVGLWFFADQTLGLEMPRLRWSQLWPLFLIGLGVWIALGSMRRR